MQSPLGDADSRVRSLSRNREAALVISVVVEVGPTTYGSFLPFSVFLQALIQGVALVVNAIAETLAGFGAITIGASVRAL